jgi:hypothetical protein
MGENPYNPSSIDNMGNPDLTGTFNGGNTYDFSGGTNGQGQMWDPNANMGSGFQNSDGSYAQDQVQYDQPAPTDWSGQNAPVDTSSGNYGSSYSDPTGQNYDPMAGIDPNSFTSADTSYGNSGDFTGGSQDTQAMAGGGAIPDGGIMQSKVAPRPMPPAPGMSGGVSPALSPSGGQQVDDVQAQGPQGPINLNSGEFVIPRDVAMWKGQEFFQNLISQSRQKRVTAPAHGKPKSPGAPPQAQQPTG